MLFLFPLYTCSSPTSFPIKLRQNMFMAITRSDQCLLKICSSCPDIESLCFSFSSCVTVWLPHSVVTVQTPCAVFCLPSTLTASASLGSCKAVKVFVQTLKYLTSDRLFFPSQVVLPTFILERRSLLEMYADFFAHPDLFVRYLTCVSR